MKKIKKIFVIFNPYDKGYYDGYGYFRGILFSKKYTEKEMAILDMKKILDSSTGQTFLKIETFKTYERN
jgi:hypothetical protein